MLVLSLLMSVCISYAQEPNQDLYKAIVESKTSVDVPQNILEQYSGSYELKPGFDLKFYIKDGSFMSKATGQDPHEMFAQSETVFSPKEFPAVIEFIKDEKGEFSSILLKQGGQEFKAVRK